MAVRGKSSRLKSDNAPTYTSAAFSRFCDLWGIKLTHGIPYIATGQANVESIYHTLKNFIEIIKEMGKHHGTN